MTSGSETCEKGTTRWIVWSRRTGKPRSRCASCSRVSYSEGRIRYSPYASVDSMPTIWHKVFKNKAPLTCANGALFLNTGGGDRQKSLCDFLSQTNRRALAPGGARSLAGSLLRSSKPLLAPRPFRHRFNSHCPAQGIQKQSPVDLRQRGFVFEYWWRRRESNPRPQALYRQFYILSTIN